VSQYQKGKTNLDSGFTGGRDSKWQWHQLGHMQICTSAQTDNHASNLPLSFFRPDAFMPPNQQRQSTEGNSYTQFTHAYYLTENQIMHPSLCMLDKVL